MIDAVAVGRDGRLSGPSLSAALMRGSRVFSKAADPAAIAGIADAGRAAIRIGYADIEGRLAGKDWAMGERFSAVDAFLLVHYRWGNRCAIDMRRDYPNFAALVDGLRAIPAVARVIAREGIQID